MLKQRLVILLITTLVLLAGWGFLEYLVDSQLMRVYQDISRYPVILYSYNMNTLQQIESTLNKETYVREVVIQPSDSIAVDLMQKYNLQGAQDILQTGTLPNVLLVYLQGSRFSAQQKNLLKLRISPYRDSVMADYQDSIWQDSLTRAQSIQRIHLFGGILFGLLMFLVFLLMRLHYEKDMAKYWKIFARAGGDIRYLRTHFWQNSVVIAFIPTAVNVLLYYSLALTNQLAHVIPFTFFIMQLVILLVSAAAAFYLTGRNYD
jgi:hypothetical protein